MRSAKKIKDTSLAALAPICAASLAALAPGCARPSVASAPSPDGDDWDEPIAGETKGASGPIAAQVLMQILYTARYCRHDLLRATGRLATMITKWNSECDRRLHRLVCYVNSTFDMKQVAYVGDNFVDLVLRIYADSDFAGDKADSNPPAVSMQLCMVRGAMSQRPLRQRSNQQCHITLLNLSWSRWIWQ